jgi:hypothetical protein
MRVSKPADTAASQDPMHRFLHRQPRTQQIVRWLVPNPRLDGIAADIAQLFWEQTLDLTDILSDGDELTAGLRKLVEAKDCMVRQALTDSEGL